MRLISPFQGQLPPEGKPRANEPFPQGEDGTKVPDEVKTNPYRAKTRTTLHGYKISGGYGCVPTPNTEVKLFRIDNTWLVNGLRG